MASVREAFILAGGLGTRLRSVVSDRPKPMALIGGRPFLEYLLDCHIGMGICRFVLSVGYMADFIWDYFGESHNGAKLTYVYEEEPLGTGGALAAACNSAAFKSDLILMLNGDTWMDASLCPLYTVVASHDVAVVMALKEVANNSRYDGVTLGRNGLVEEFAVKDKKSVLVNTGRYALNLARLLPFLSQMPPVFSFERDLVPLLVKKKEAAGCILEGEFVDIGVPEDYAALKSRQGKFFARLE